MKTPESRVLTVLLIFVAVHTIALIISPLLPFIDLPNHLAEAVIFKSYGEEGSSVDQYYKPVPGYFPNTLHPVFCSWFSNVEAGNKVFHILCITLLATSVYLIIRKLNGNQWYGLLALLFTYNYNLTYGFVGFAMSIPLLFFLFYLILLDVERDGLATKFAIAGVLILLFLAHAQNALLGLLLFGVMMLYIFRKAPLKFIVRVVTIPIPLIVLLLVWWITRDKQNESSTLEYLMNYYSSAYFTEFPMRFRIVVFDNFQLADGIPGITIASVFFACVLIPVIWFRAWKNIPAASKDNRATLVFIFFVVAFGCYMILPDKLPGQTPLFQRFTTIVMLIAIICCSLLLRGITSRALKYFSCVVVVSYSIFWIEYVHAFNVANKDFNSVFFPDVAPSSRIAGLIYDSKYRGRKVYIHYPNYFLVWNKGVAASKIIDYRFGLVRRVAPETTLPFYNELISDGYRRIDTYDRLEYLLVRGNAPMQPDHNLENFSMVNESGPWRLYRNILSAKLE